MKRILLFLLVLSLPFAKTFSQCTETTKPKVLLIGDSWGFFMNFEQTINKVLKAWGHSNYTYISSGNIVVNGADTYDFLEQSKQDEIRNLITQNPSIEVVHMSLGGNDFLGDWKVSFNQAQTDTLTGEVMVRLDSIVRFLKTCKPGIRILWGGYAYTNFTEPITKPGLFSGSSHPFYGTWEGMEFPSFSQINNLLNDVSTIMENYAANDPQMDFVNAVGILQYTTGQTSPICCNLSPQGTYMPYSVPLPLGDPSYPSPMSTMRDYLTLTKDCYHLSPQGYFDFVSYHAQKFYQKLFMDEVYLLSENNSQSGTVTSQGNTSDSLFLGESGGEQFSVVLSFNTTTALDTTLEKASIFLRRSSLTGTNPISGNLEVKVKNGNFGTTVNVEAADYSDAGDASTTPCLFGSNTANGEWIRLDMPSSVLTYIKTDAPTQFVISAPGFTGGKVNFSNSANPDFAPVLNLDYAGNETTGIRELALQNFTIYPNPVHDYLTIKTRGEIIERVEMFDILGKSVLQPRANTSVIDVSPLAPGMYIISITTPNGTATQRVVKN